ncbi:MAG TPA: hypothetical protein VM534_01275 [Thermoanaerobaculia bacterium]|nr:hypothetical protein [Thermoanaerobaculia bacterium]
MFFCRSPEDARRIAGNGLALPGVVLKFIDTRESFRRLRPGTIWAENFHKKRARGRLRS